MTCAYCGKEGKWLCDFAVPVAHRQAGSPTCDKPLCDDHRKNVGRGIACRRGKGGGSTVFSVDYCPDHAAQAK